MTIDINKTYQTKAGHDVQIFTTGAPGLHPVVGIRWVPGYYGTAGGRWIPTSWAGTGQYVRGEERSLDLVEVKPKRLVYVNLHPYDKELVIGDYFPYPTQDEAKKYASACAIAVAIPVYIEEEE